MGEERSRNVLLGITITGILLGSIVMMYVPTKPAEPVVIQENQFPEQVETEPGVTTGVTSHRFNLLFSLGLFARRYLSRVEVKYSFLTLDTSLNLTELNRQTQRYGDLSDCIDEIAFLLNQTKDYPARPEILDTDLVLENEEYRGRVYDFTKFLSPSATSQIAKEALVAFLVVFDDDGRVLRYYKGISDFVDEATTGLKLVSLTILRAPDKETYYAGSLTDQEDAKPMEERPSMGVVCFDDVDRASTLGIVSNTEHKGGGRAECLQLIRVYVNGKIEEVVPNPITVSG